ncbi:hypothetical protein OSB04_010310 [Centaurea solstitialis]|uniref:Uncharacterized protein n=1 Tax=Centaurea solstitialis TaxID=347529 RepID=A0AA38WP80_9ASTR|nr:hypothetical protein OSB04_010310 [Centaurea solstitialis]
MDLVFFFLTKNSLIIGRSDAEEGEASEEVEGAGKNEGEACEEGNGGVRYGYLLENENGRRSPIVDILGPLLTLVSSLPSSPSLQSEKAMGYVLRVRFAAFFAGAAVASAGGFYFLHKDYKLAHQSMSQQVEQV